MTRPGGLGEPSGWPSCVDIEKVRPIRYLAFRSGGVSAAAAVRPPASAIAAAEARTATNAAAVPNLRFLPYRRMFLLLRTHVGAFNLFVIECSAPSAKASTTRSLTVSCAGAQSDFG